MNACRDAACEALRDAGFPTRKSERYRYTDMEALFSPDYGVNLRRLKPGGNPYKDFRCFVPGMDSSLYFILNDAFCPPEKEDPGLPSGVIVDSLARAAAESPERVRDRYNALAGTSDAVCALNAMLAQDGLFVYVSQGVRLERPLQIVNLLRSGADMMTNRRVLVILEDGASAEILFCDHADSDVNFLSTQVTEIFMGDGASLDMTSVEESHRRNHLVSNTYVKQGARSRLVHNIVTLHNGTTRNQLDVTLAGEGADCEINGCVILDKEQHADNNTLVTHAAGHCTSRELYKYVVGGSSRGAFAGRVLVKPGAQKTDSAMRNQNLCTTKEARMWTQPMLEIYADDVKCSHGATVGQLNDAALFYMRQRGIPLAEAKRLLETAFAAEVIDNIRLERLRDRLRYLVEKRFRGELSTCEGCSLCK